MLLLLQEAWQAAALGRRYLQELENWLELVVFLLALSTLVFKESLETLKVTLQLQQG